MPIKINPVNKMLLVERKPVAKKEDEFGFILPTKVSYDKHLVVNLKAAPENSQYEKNIGNDILVVGAMIEQVEINKEVFNLVSENGVVGIIAESDLF